jgi:hypothetical protein
LDGKYAVVEPLTPDQIFEELARDDPEEFEDRF